MDSVHSIVTGINGTVRQVYVEIIILIQNIK